ncbi:MAG: hypothetical protein U0802_03460 [Candidatus Binatia bacterium]
MRPSLEVTIEVGGHPGGQAQRGRHPGDRGAVNDDNVLVLGGPDAEYNGCPNFLILNHSSTAPKIRSLMTAARS